MRSLAASVPVAAPVRDLVVPCTNALRGLQDSTGRFIRRLDTAQRLITDLMRPIGDIADQLDQAALYRAMLADMDEWLAAGLDQPPVFDRTRDSFRPPSGDGPFFYFGPARLSAGTSSDGCYIETFLAWREEPPELSEPAARYRSTGPIDCRPARLVHASEGLARGNCLSCRAADIPATDETSKTADGLAFNNKFHMIYRRQTLPRARRVFGVRDCFFGSNLWCSGTLTAEEGYNARCMLDRLQTAQQEPMPDEAGESASVLRQALSDIRVALACLDDTHPFGNAMFQFLLLDRMLRCPILRDADRDRQAAAGLLLFEWLFRHDALREGRSAPLTTDTTALRNGLAAMESVIAMALRPGSAAEREAAADAFLRDYLPPGDDGTLYSCPDAYRMIAGIPEKTELLRFDDLEY